MRTKDASEQNALLRTLRFKKELAPAVVLVIAVGILLSPLFNGTDGISELREELQVLRSTYSQTGIRTLQHHLGEQQNGTDHATAVDYSDELPEISAGLWQVSRFFSGMQRELAELESAIHSAHDIPETQADIADWVANLYELDERFGSLMLRLSEIETARNRAYNSMGLFGILLSLLFVVLYLKQGAQLELAEREQTYQKRMARLASKIQEDERRALARDLHDGTAQELAIARMAVDKVKDQRIRSTIEESLTRAIEEIRFLARRMRPMPEVHGTMSEMVRELCEYFESRYSLEFTLVLDRRIRPIWSEDAMVNLYRIVQESLFNIVRHADASQVHVHLQELNKEQAEISIHDNGVGLHGAPDGFGTRSIRERAELIRASFTRESPHEGGTIVRLRFPLELESHG